MLLRRSSLLLLAGLLQLLSSSTCILETIDTTQPILRQVQGLGEYDYFGYSLVLHQLQNNIGSRDQALAQTRYDFFFNAQLEVIYIEMMMLVWHDA